MTNPTPDDGTDANPSTIEAVNPTAAEPADAEADEGAGGNREAANYRRRLREVEAERDGLNERLTVMGSQLTSAQRVEVERLAGAQLSRPADVWLDDAELTTLVDDDGRVDPARVEAAVTAVLDGRPQLAIPVRRMQPDFSQGSAGSESTSRVSMADLLKSAKGR